MAIKWQLKTMKLDELTDYFKNPRTMTGKEYDRLKESIDKFGMIDKIIVNADPAQTVIGGHQRKHVLEESGVVESECWIPERELTEKEVEELNIRLNQNTGSWDFDILANQFEFTDLLDWGFEERDLHFDDSDALDLESEDDDFEDELDEYICPKCGFKFQV